MKIVLTENDAVMDEDSRAGTSRRWWVSVHMTQRIGGCKFVSSYNHVMQLQLVFVTEARGLDLCLAAISDD